MKWFKKWTTKAEYSLKSVLMMVITVAVAMLMVPVIQVGIDGANLSGSAATLADTILVFYIIAVVIMVVMGAIKAAD